MEEIIDIRKKLIQHFKKKNYHKALQYITEAQQQLPEDRDFLLYRGLCLYHLKRVSEALDIFGRLYSVATDTTPISISKIYCILLLREKKYKAAQSVLENHLNNEKYKTDLQFMNMLAYTFDKQGDTDQAYIYYKKNKKKAQAKELVKTALAQEPKNKVYIDTLYSISRM